MALLQNCTPSTTEILESFKRQGFVGTDPLACSAEWTGGDLLCVDRKTGVLRSEKRYSSLEIANYWTDVIFKSTNPDDYSASNPFAHSRLLYVLLSVIEFLKRSNIEIKTLCDFATGQGVFLRYAREYMPDISITGTEASASLASRLMEDGFSVSNKTLGKAGQQAEFEVDFGTVSWTLCNCIDVVDVLLDIRNHIRDDGYLCVSDSSRILVPFRKSLRDYITSNHPLDMHPHFFSLKSLSALLGATGFKIEWVNRYFDSDVLCIIAKKVELPSDDTLFATDDPSDIKDFLQKWHEQSKYFESLRP